MGFEDQIGQNFEPAYPATEDIFVAHEAELTQSGRYVFVTDERGGGILPVGATCAPGADNDLGNGGIHAFRVDRLGTAFPSVPGDAVKAYQERVYAKDSKGNRAIYRAPINTRPQGAVCTSHVFQQIPGQNRIFMAWYSQGTQVVDFTENENGSIKFKTAGYFIPENANEWVSHIFKVQENEDGSFTYWGAAADFALADGGRNAIDIYKVTLPSPPRPRFDEPAATPPGSAGPPGQDGEVPGTPTFPVSQQRGQEVGAPTPACARASGFNSVAAAPVRKGRRVRFSFSRASDRPVRVQVFRHSKGRRMGGEEGRRRLLPGALHDDCAQPAPRHAPARLAAQERQVPSGGSVRSPPELQPPPVLRLVAAGFRRQDARGAQGDLPAAEHGDRRHRGAPRKQGRQAIQGEELPAQAAAQAEAASGTQGQAGRVRVQDEGEPPRRGE